jgi:hypothetical protein
VCVDKVQQPFAGTQASTCLDGKELKRQRERKHASGMTAEHQDALNKHRQEVYARRCIVTTASFVVEMYCHHCCLCAALSLAWGQRHGKRVCRLKELQLTYHLRANLNFQSL